MDSWSKVMCICGNGIPFLFWILIVVGVGDLIVVYVLNLVIFGIYLKSRFNPSIFGIVYLKP